MPQTARLVFHRPQGLDASSAKAFTALVLERIRAIEDQVASQRGRTGARILGRKGVLSQKWSDRPGSREPRRQLNPRVAARSKWSRIEALLRNRAFRDAYASARDALTAGFRDVIFPAGTYWLRRFTHVPCAPLPAPT